MGLINIQFAIKDEKVYVIEANPRASQAVTFCQSISKPYINYATKVMLEDKMLKDFTFSQKKKAMQ